MKPKQKRLYVKRQKALAEAAKTVVVEEVAEVEEVTKVEEKPVAKKTVAKEKPVVKKQKSMWSRKKKD